MTCLNKLASEVLNKVDTANRLEKASSLTELFQIVSQTVTLFAQRVLDTNLANQYNLFDDDQVILERLALHYSEVNSNDLSHQQFANVLVEAMRYSLLGSGKMLRPCLVFIAGYLFANDRQTLENILIASLAVESVHTYSLIHDDLPAMDNDDYRRGRLTNHKVYGEDHAILAGDALQTLAFTLLSNNQNNAQQILKQVQILAYGAGHLGMCLGQSYDLLSERIDLSKQNSKQLLLAKLTEIHYRKTAYLIRASVLLGLYSSKYYNDSKLANIFTQ